ncbi:MAG: cohesin domain-containing protein [Patescibacteria group bacterium]|nr:cohesin domain-containing protein [Patescibacteria group bacterium]
MKLKDLPIAIGVFILFLTIPTAVYLSTQPESLQTLTKAGQEESAVIYLWPAKLETNLDSQFEITITLASPEQEVKEAHAVINYDPKMLDVVEIKKGPILGSYEKRNIETGKGQIEIAAQGNFQGSGTLGSIVFIPKKTGNTNLNLIKSGSKVLEAGGANILQGVNGTTVTIK